MEDLDEPFAALRPLLTPQEATPQLLAELSELVDLGVERYRADGLA